MTISYPRARQSFCRDLLTPGLKPAACRPGCGQRGPPSMSDGVTGVPVACSNVTRRATRAGTPRSPSLALVPSRPTSYRIAQLIWGQASVFESNSFKSYTSHPTCVKCAKVLWNDYSRYQPGALPSTRGSQRRESRDSSVASSSVAIAPSRQRPGPRGGGR
jgi:hypothetical protein